LNLPNATWWTIKRCCGKGGTLISMSGRGTCNDDSMMEAFFTTLRSQLIWPVAPLSRQQAENPIAFARMARKGGQTFPRKAGRVQKQANGSRALGDVLQRFVGSVEP
jgi:hypothetical protein